MTQKITVLLIISIGCLAGTCAQSNTTEALEALAAQFPNITALAAAEGWTGWSNLSANPCAANRHDGLNWTHLGCTDGVVTVLNFTGVPLNGTLTGMDWQLFPDVTQFLFQDCNLTGALPSDLPSQQPNLQSIDVSLNRPDTASSTGATPGLQGQLPPSWGSFGQLQYLNLRGNSFTGSIPQEWQSLQQLRSLYLNVNQLTGVLVGQWSAAWPQLTYFRLDENQMTGTLPAEFANFGEMYVIILDSNQFTGTLPPEYANLPTMDTFSLSQNQLTGTLPPEWGWTDFIRTGIDGLLWLDSNMLEGPVPDSYSGNGSMITMVLKPGNTGLCGGDETDFRAQQTTADFTSQSDINLGACPPPPPLPSPPPPPSTPVVASTPPPQQSQSSPLSGGAIAGIVIGVVAAFILTIVALFLFTMRRGRKQGPPTSIDRAPMVDSSSRSDQAIEMTTTTSSSGNTGSRPASRGSKRSKGSRGSSRSRDSGLEWFKTEVKGSRARPPMLKFDWHIAPHRIEICARQNGEAWRLGSGGYGTVYKARLDGITDVAVKLLKPEASSAPDCADKFEKECMIMRACRNDNIVSFLGAWQHEDYAYMVQELMLRGDLYSALADPKLEGMLAWEKRGRQVAKQVAQALHYLHRNHVVHLDIKSPNILLDEHLNAKVADTGLARTLFTKTHLSQTMLGGTFSWQAPETLLGQPSSYPADIWSFGVVMLEIITGQPQERRQYTMPKPHQCSQIIADLVDACMQTEAHLRPTAREVILAIDRDITQAG